MYAYAVVAAVLLLVNRLSGLVDYSGSLRSMITFPCCNCRRRSVRRFLSIWGLLPRQHMFHTIRARCAVLQLADPGSGYQGMHCLARFAYRLLQPVYRHVQRALRRGSNLCAGCRAC